MALAQRAGLGSAIAGHVRLSRPCGLNAQVKVPCLVAGMIAGADNIDDMALLRHGAMGMLFGGSGLHPPWDRFCVPSPGGTCCKLQKVHRERQAARSHRTAASSALR
jgi:hypothetical protein